MKAYQAILMICICGVLLGWVLADKVREQVKEEEGE